MSTEGPDREIARLFEEQRRADEASVPGFRELLARPRIRRASAEPWLGRAVPAAAALAILTTILVVRRSSLPRAPEEIPAAAATLAAWKAPTDFLLKTPGGELLSRVPDLLPRSPQTTTAPAPAMKASPTIKGVEI